ncbi:hypothetical protein Rhopal_004617-T1 [Rhodotorula paludigena]|uniref:Saccharopine dehydrogenase NADP binding domain-containing protein n=1 Tax=Rhodotorula paludigena TaxID=86838 RepID=A0AAV5GQS0_9BASI|nr:hypothetical protein Rhopal_004617-T1 [Rhodotorula paludigena]
MSTADILLYGASGFTGQLVAEALATQAAWQKFTWAAGGRNRQKLEERMKEVNVEPKAYLVADSMDEEGLRRIVKQVKVVITVVGPYLQYGEPLVKVCAEEGVHLVDLTGETPFMSRTVQRYSHQAQQSKALILHACGFDSVPSDLGTLLAVQRLQKLGPDVYAGKVRSGFKARGGFSGGTFMSLIGILESENSAEVKSAFKRYSLSPAKGEHSGAPVVVGSARFKGKRTYGMAFLMAPINCAVVERTWGILESADASKRALRYGPKFVYDEFMTLPNPIVAFLGSAFFYLAFGALLLPPVRWLAKRFGLKSGDGPPRDAQQKGWYEVTTYATSEDGTKEVKVVGKGKGDPGYLATSWLISSCALCLLKDYDRLPTIAKDGGFLTPALALGNVLVERLEKTGRFSWTVEDNQDKDK